MFSLKYYIMQFMQQNKRNLYTTYSKRRLFVHQVRDKDMQKWREGKIVICTNPISADASNNVNVAQLEIE